MIAKLTIVVANIGHRSSVGGNGGLLIRSISFCQLAHHASCYRDFIQLTFDRVMFPIGLAIRRKDELVAVGSPHNLAVVVIRPKGDLS